MKDLLAFAFAVAERIVGAAARGQAGVAEQNLDKALRMVDGWTDLVARVHPVDLERIETYADSLHETLGRQKHLTVRPDDGIQPGGCIVETRVGSVDATIEGQLRSAAELLFGAEPRRSVGAESRRSSGAVPERLSGTGSREGKEETETEAGGRTRRGAGHAEVTKAEDRPEDMGAQP